MPPDPIPGFISRAKAEREYGRSKSSFIRDVVDAFERNDTQFLNHFRVQLKDGTIIDGPDATKVALQAVQSKQPRWHIETAFLDSRYWHQGSDDSEEERQSTKATRSTSAGSRHGSESVALQHQLELAQQHISTQGETIIRLEDDKAFLHKELESRRGEIDKLRGFFESIGEAADSTAKLRSGPQSEPMDVVSANLSRDGKHTTGKGSFVERHLPTFRKLITYRRSR